MEQIEGQISIFEFLLETKNIKKNYNFDALMEFTHMGSGFQNGKARILDFFRINKSKKDRTSFLKSEYGYGGFASPRKSMDEYQLHSADHTAKNIKLSWYVPGKAESEEKTFTYEQLSDAIEECILQGSY